MSNANSIYLALLFVLNYVDALFTLVWVGLGVASEANPLMETLVHDPILFVAVKVAIVSLGCYLLHRYSHKRFAQWAIRIGFASYMCILGIHSVFVVRVLGL